MDRKYDGRAWCKVITTNNKNNFGLSFKKARCLGHLHCVQNDYENFVCVGSYNEIFWYNECTHIPIVGQVALSPSASSLACKFCHVLLFCVSAYSGRIYYVVHRFQLISRAFIHLGVHKHPMVEANQGVSG